MKIELAYKDPSKADFLATIKRKDKKDITNSKMLRQATQVLGNRKRENITYQESILCTSINSDDAEPVVDDKVDHLLDHLQ